LQQYIDVPVYDPNRILAKALIDRLFDPAAAAPGSVSTTDTL